MESKTAKTVSKRLLLAATLGIVALVAGVALVPSARSQQDNRKTTENIVDRNASKMIDEGRQTFRFNTFGDEAFWGGTIQLHQAIEGSALGGVGSGVSPKTALAVG